MRDESLQKTEKVSGSDGRTSGHLVLASPTTGQRLIGIEGLRGLAAISVLIAHVHVHLGANVNLGLWKPLVDVMGQGLTLFFALSGFLLYRPFVAHWIEGRPFPNVRRFLTNRALRIYPAYIVILMFVSLVLGVAYTESIQAGKDVEAAESTVGFMTNPLLLILNSTLLHTLLPISIKTGLGVSWSLTVEVAFYLVLPLLAILALRLKPRPGKKGLSANKVFLPPLLLLVVGLISKGILAYVTHGATPADEFYLNWGGNWTAVFSRSLLVHADLFAFGMVAAVLVAWERSGRMSSQARKILIGSAALAIPLAVFVAKATKLDDTMFAFAAAAIILLVSVRKLGGGPNLMANTLELLPFRFAGLISYSFYLWHIPVIWLLARQGLVFPADLLWANVILVLVTTIALASVTYYLIEVPALRLKKATDSKPQNNSVGTDEQVGAHGKLESK